VGSKNVTDEARARDIIRDVLRRLSPSVVVSGGCAGIDQLAANEAQAAGLWVVECLPLAQAWPQFKARNNDIARFCDKLVRIHEPTSTTYGSGFTRDQAARLGKPTEDLAL
jgi:hypothetical protein